MAPCRKHKKYTYVARVRFYVSILPMKVLRLKHQGYCIFFRQMDLLNLNLFFFAYAAGVAASCTLAPGWAILWLTDKSRHCFILLPGAIFKCTDTSTQKHKNTQTLLVHTKVFKYNDEVSLTIQSCCTNTLLFIYKNNQFLKKWKMF